MDEIKDIIKKLEKELYGTEELSKSRTVGNGIDHIDVIKIISLKPLIAEWHMEVPGLDEKLRKASAMLTKLVKK